MRALLLLPIVAGCTLTGSGSTYSGPRPTGSTPAQASASSNGTAYTPPAPAAATQATLAPDGNGVVYFPVSSAPVDPWSAVAGNAPVAFTGGGTQWRMVADYQPCTAARDHCLPALVWFWAHERTLQQPSGNGQPMIFGPTGILPSADAGHDDTPQFVAYRTVPATRKNLAPGVHVAVFPVKPLPSARSTSYDTWTMGTVDRIDWEMGFVYINDHSSPYYLTATRVSVLMYTPTTGITVLDGRARDHLGVGATDVILP